MFERIEKLIEQGRDGYEARLAAGQARLGNGDVERAIEHLQEAVAFDAGRSMAWQLLGKALLANDEPEAARSAWQRGLQTARAAGDKQVEKTIGVFLKRLDKQA